ncbi:MAG: hypothetical protein KL787_04525 [Taibaiella sp.]|nr:hypothetical protein [Taibaiella sp.]
MRKFLGLLGCTCILGMNLNAQQVYITADDPDKQLADRLITLYGTTGDSIHTNTSLLSYLELSYLYKNMKIDVYNARLSNVDIYDVSKLLYASSDYNLMPQDPFFKAPTNDGTFGFYNQTSYLFEKVGNFHLMFQPQAQVYGYVDQEGLFSFTSAAGMFARAKIGNRFGLYVSGTYHRDLLPEFYSRYVAQYQAMPGVGRYRSIPLDGYNAFQNVDYFLVKRACVI